MVDLVSGGSVINKAYPVYFYAKRTSFLQKLRLGTLHLASCAKMLKGLWYWYITFTNWVKLEFIKWFSHSYIHFFYGEGGGIGIGERYGVQVEAGQNGQLICKHFDTKYLVSVGSQMLIMNFKKKNCTISIQNMNSNISLSPEIALKLRYE